MSLAMWVNRRLVVSDGEGGIAPPGGDRAGHWRQADRSEVTFIARGDAFDLVVRTRFGVIYTLPLEARTALAIAFWLVRWWAGTQWFGLKTWLWHWSFTRLVSSGNRAKAAPRRLGERRA